MEKITVAKAAELLGKSQDFVRWGLRQGKLPIGAAVKSERGERWNYIIVPKLLKDFTGIEVTENE